MSQFSLVKAKFIEITGRADLSDPAAAFDAGFFINEGQKYLDRLFNRGKSEARHFVNLTAGQVIVPLANVRSFKEVGFLMLIIAINWMLKTLPLCETTTINQLQV